MLFVVHEIYQKFVIDIYNKHFFIVEYVFIFVDKHNDNE